MLSVAIGILIPSTVKDVKLSNVGLVSFEMGDRIRISISCDSLLMLMIMMMMMMMADG